MDEFRTAGTPKLEPEGDPDAIFVAAQMMRVVGSDWSALGSLQRRATLIREWGKFLEEWPILLCPVSGETPFEQHTDVRSEADFDRILRAQVLQVGLPALGLPGLTVATGAPRQPMGVQLLGKRYREDSRPEAGAAIEAALPPIRPVDPFVNG